MHLYANLEIRNVDLEMPWDRADIVEREMELEKVFKDDLVNKIR